MDEGLFEYGCANAKTDHHPVGTCKMGTDRMSVGDTTAGRILTTKGLAERKDYRDTRDWCRRL
jgi:choline dehydrogenase-like flavoprotein